jgi:mevalonate kinase
MITVSVPAKVHLMGEHAVVHGKPALLSAINLRMTVSIEPSAHGVDIISTESTQPVYDALSFLSKTYKLPQVPDIKLTIRSAFPAGFHLGSSAAMAVGVTAAYTYFVKKTWNPMVINQLAYELEKVHHGNPSGGDNTTVTMGGFVWFRKELEFLKSMWQLPFRLPASLNHFSLINTGKPVETTAEMVTMVQKNAEESPSKMNALFDENEKQTRRIATALKTADEKTLIDAIQQGERTLEGMGVVSPIVQPLIRSLEQEGAAVKILGGGGKKNHVGFLLCYHKDIAVVERLSESHGYTVQSVQLGEEGIRLEQKS